MGDQRSFKKKIKLNEFKKFLNGLYTLKRAGSIDGGSEVEFEGKKLFVKEIEKAESVLPRRQKQAYTMTVKEGLKQEDIADFMGMAQSNVVRYRDLAIKKIMAYLFGDI